MNYIAEPRGIGELRPITYIESGMNDLFPCFLEVGELEDVGGDGKIATVQLLPTRAKFSDSAPKAAYISA